MKLYGRAHHAANLQQFERLMQMNNDIQFYQPDPERAPWHVQAKVNGVTLNFWPHLLKGNVERTRAVQGYSALQRMIGDARSEADVDLIE